MGIACEEVDQEAVTPFLAGLYALNIGRLSIINTPDQIADYKLAHPEVMLEKSEKLLLACGKRENKPTQPPANQYKMAVEMYPVQTTAEQVCEQDASISGQT